MEKKHELPEFQVILQNEANAKFFVASGPGDPFTPGPTSASTGPKIATAQYVHEEEDDSVW